MPAAFLVAQANSGNKVDDAAETLLVQVGPGIFLGQDTFERGVVPLNGDHGAIQQLANNRVFGPALQVGPPGLRRHPKDVFGGVFVPILGIGTFILHQRGVLFIESVGDIFEENEAQDDMFILCGIQVASEFIRSRPEGWPQIPARCLNSQKICGCYWLPYLGYTASKTFMKL